MMDEKELAASGRFIYLENMVASPLHYGESEGAAIAKRFSQQLKEEMRRLEKEATDFWMQLSYPQKNESWDLPTMESQMCKVLWLNVPKVEPKQKIEFEGRTYRLIHWRGIFLQFARE